MVGIYSKSLVRDIGKVFIIVFLLFFLSLKTIDPYDHYAGCCVPLNKLCDPDYSLVIYDGL